MQKHYNKLSTKKVFYITKSRSNIQQNRRWGGGEGLQQGITAFPSKFPAANFSSQGDAHVRTDIQIKFCIIR